MLNHVKPISTGRPPQAHISQRACKKDQMTATNRISYSMNSNLASIPETTKSWRWSTDHPESFASPSTCRTALAALAAPGCLGSQNGLVTPSRPWKGVRPKFAANFACLLPSANLKILALSQKETGKYWVTGRFLYFVDLVISARARCWKRPRPGCSSRKLAALCVSRKKGYRIQLSRWDTNANHGRNLLVFNVFLLCGRGLGSSALRSHLSLNSPQPLVLVEVRTASIWTETHLFADATLWLPHKDAEKMGLDANWFPNATAEPRCWNLWRTGIQLNVVG